MDGLYHVICKKRYRYLMGQRSILVRIIYEKNHLETHYLIWQALNSIITCGLIILFPFLNDDIEYLHFDISNHRQMSWNGLTCMWLHGHESLNKLYIFNVKTKDLL